MEPDREAAPDAAPIPPGEAAARPEEVERVLDQVDGALAALDAGDLERAEVLTASLDSAAPKPDTPSASPAPGSG